jgi:hypothetical protein
VVRRCDRLAAGFQLLGHAIRGLGIGAPHDALFGFPSEQWMEH